MAYRPITLRNSKIRPHKAFMEPKFDAPTIIVGDQFDYVDLWLKRNSTLESVLYWQQAKNFYIAAIDVPKESKPIVAYYCLLNATKALLASKKISFSPLHGLAGTSNGNKTSLANEISKIKGKGLLFSLARYYSANICGRSISMKDALYNLPFVHRAYTVTYRGTLDLFIPISDPHFVRQPNGYEAWFCAEIIDEKYKKTNIFNRQRGWEVDKGSKNKFIIRRKRRFKWDTSRGTRKADRIKKLIRYHQKIRRDIKYIHSAQRLWYFKRNDRVAGVLPWPTPVLIYIVMHRLSELARYNPKRLQRHFQCQHNWLLAEFIH